MRVLEAKTEGEIVMDQSGSNNPAYRHGHTNNGKFTPTYHSWASMLVRCYNPKRSSYKWYGAKGITVCDEWHTFENFLRDMGVRPDGMTLDRKDNALGYSKDNCRWADATTQARNSVQVVWVEIDGVSKRLVEWCEELCVPINTVRARVKNQGMDYATAITKSCHPIRHEAL